MDKQFDSLCKIHNPFGFVENGKIEELEDSKPDLIIELNWKDFCDKFYLDLTIDSGTSIEKIHKVYRDRHGEQEFNNFYWTSGSLGRKQVDKTVELLNERFITDSFYCFFSLIANLHLENPEDKIYLTDFSGLKQLIENKKTFTPTIWWDKKTKWLVYTDSDLTSSYIFSDKGLIETIIKDSELESYKLDIKNYSKDFDKNILK